MKKLLTIMFLLIAQSSFALLPPLAQSIDELKQLLNDRQLGQKLGMAEPIEEIRRMNGGYLILTPQQQLQVDINYNPSRRIGPAQFTFEFHEATQR